MKPFKCSVCDVKFTNKQNLRKHIDCVHKGIKPFNCKSCDYKAAYKVDLKKHIESVHEGII